MSDHTGDGGQAGGSGVGDKRHREADDTDGAANNQAPGAFSSSSGPFSSSFGAFSSSFGAFSSSFGPFSSSSGPFSSSSGPFSSSSGPFSSSSGPFSSSFGAFSSSFGPVSSSSGAFDLPFSSGHSSFFPHTYASSIFGRVELLSLHREQAYLRHELGRLRADGKAIRDGLLCALRFAREDLLASPALIEAALPMPRDLIRAHLAHLQEDSVAALMQVAVENYITDPFNAPPPPFPAEEEGEEDEEEKEEKAEEERKKLKREAEEDALAPVSRAALLAQLSRLAAMASGIVSEVSAARLLLPPWLDPRCDPVTFLRR